MKRQLFMSVSHYVQNLNWKFKKFKASQIELKILNWKKNKDVFEKIEKAWKLLKLDKVQN